MALVIKEVTLEELREPSWQDRWETLLSQAIAATPYQSPNFAITWFSNYRTYTPVLVQQTNENQELTALMVLAKNQHNALLPVGTFQNEYQQWLQISADNLFMEQAIPAIFSAYPKQKTLQFKYLTENLTTVALPQSSHISERTHTRPLITLESEQIEKSFKKKGNKSKINRLAKIGELSFRKIDDIAEFEALFDEIITLYDARQGATNDSFPFHDDPNKRPFHIELFKLGLLHTTVLYVGDELVSAHIGLGHEQFLHLAIIAMSPYFSAHSPGKMQIMHLNRILVEEGFKTFDLTPGGDPWKDRFSNLEDTVAEVTFFRHKYQLTIKNISESLLNVTKAILTKAGIDKTKAKQLLTNVTNRRKSEVVSGKNETLGKEVQIYRLQQVNNSHQASNKKRNDKRALEDLLLFQATEHSESKQHFIQEVINRLESNQQPYLYVNNGKLSYSSWLNKFAKKSYFSEIAQSYDYPENSALIHGFYSVPSMSNKETYKENICEILGDLGKENIESIFIPIPSSNSELKLAVEALGFEYIESLNDKNKAH